MYSVLALYIKKYYLRLVSSFIMRQLHVVLEAEPLYITAFLAFVSVSMFKSKRIHCHLFAQAHSGVYAGVYSLTVVQKKSKIKAMCS